MELEPYVEEIQRHVALAAEAGGDDARALADRLMAPLDATVRLALQHALADAADRITVELAPGSVELRARGRELAFVVTPAPADPPPAGDASDESSMGVLEPPPDDDGATARINVRMPEHLKTRIEQAAAAQHMSVNAWLVRAAVAAVDRAETTPSFERSTTRGPHRYRGWAR
jgi:uncharacterized protein DUF1778